MSDYLDARPFVVAWERTGDFEINMQQVNALHEWHALQLALENVIFESSDFHTITTMEALGEKAWENGEYVFSVMEVE